VTRTREIEVIDSCFEYVVDVYRLTDDSERVKMRFSKRTVSILSKHSHTQMRRMTTAQGSRTWALFDLKRALQSRSEPDSLS